MTNPTAAHGVDRAAELRARFRQCNPLNGEQAVAPAVKRVARATRVRQPAASDADADRKRRFADNLNKLLIRNGWKQADLARRMFGTTTDTKGFARAQNADAVSQYCAGRSMPEGNRLAHMAEVLGVAVEELTGEKPSPPTGVRFAPARDATTGRLVIDQNVSKATAAKIMQLLMDDKTP